MTLFDNSFSKDSLQEITHDANAQQHAIDVSTVIANAAKRGRDYCNVKDLRPNELHELQELGLFVEWTAGTYYISWAN